jgi:hypothetical protein
MLVAFSFYSAGAELVIAMVRSTGLAGIRERGKGMEWIAQEPGSS